MTEHVTASSGSAFAAARGDVDVRVLGPVELIVDGRPARLGGRMPERILALLAVRANRVVTRHELTEALWGDHPPLSEAHALRVHESRLRRALRSAGRESILRSSQGGLSLVVDRGAVDALRFQDVLAEGREALAAGDFERAAERLGTALDEWRADNVAGGGEDPPPAPALARLVDLRLAALEARNDAELALGRHVDLLGELHELVVRHPLDERLRAQLMLALYRAGRQADALEVYRETRRLLVDELGVEPCAELADLERRILRHDPELEPWQRRAPPPEAPTAAPSPALPPTSEKADGAHATRRTITVVVCGVTATSPEGHRLDPELARRVGLACLDQIRAVVELHGGTVEGDVGDEVIGAFGLTSAHEDDALRALRAALEIPRVVRDVEQRLRPSVRLAVAIGVETGETVVGTTNGGSALIGMGIVTDAARLRASVDPPGILVGPRTCELTLHAVRLGPPVRLEPPLGGPGVPARVLEAIEPNAGLFPLSGAPLVGREHELDLLHDALQAVRSERRPRLVTVVGEAGIGKTRLLEEFTTSLGDAARTVTGHCAPSGQRSAYRPLAEILLGLRRDGDDLPHLIAGALADDERGEQVAGLVLTAVGTSDVPASTEEIQWAARRLLEALAREQPLVIVIEDLHWAEPAFLHLIDYVAGTSGGVRLLLVAATREDLLEAHPTWAIPRPYRQLISLPALRDEEARILVRGVERLTPPEEDEVVATGAGNPLFLEQLAMSYGEGGGTRPTAPTPNLAALVAARLDRLEPAERDLLERASVVGTTFGRRAVAALARSDDEGDLDELLLGAIRRGFVRAAPRHTPGDDTYRFAHALVCEAIHESLPRELRAQLHERHAGWLESSVGAAADRDEAVGYHLEAAHDDLVAVGRDDDHVRQLAEAAGEHLYAVGRRAANRGDEHGARTLLHRAVALQPEGAALLRSLSLLSWVACEDDELEWIANRMTDVTDRLDDDALRAWARLHLIDAQAELGSMAVRDASSEMDAAIPALEKREDDLPEALVLALCLSGLLARRRGLECLAGQRFARATEVAERHGLAAEADQLTGLLVGSWILGETPADEAERRVRRILARGRLDEPLRLHVAWRYAWLLILTGRVAEGRTLAEEVFDRADEIGFRELLVGARVVLALGAERFADPARALTLLEPVLDVVVTGGWQNWGFDDALACLYCDLGRPADALPLVATPPPDDTDLRSAVLWRVGRARALSGLGRSLTEAHALARRAVEQTTGVEQIDLRFDALVALAEVASALDSPAESRSALEEATLLLARKGFAPSAHLVRLTAALDQSTTATLVTAHTGDRAPSQAPGR